MSGDQTRHGLSPELHYTTIPPPEETAKAEKPFHPLARAGLLPQERILLMTIVGSLWGFVAGSYIGGRQSGLQYLAENAHRLPRTVQGWYFYHKTKNYKVMYGGIKRGARYAGQTGAVVMAYATLEAVFDRVRGEADVLNSIAAGGVVGSSFSMLAKLSRYSSRYAVGFGLLGGLLTGTLSDLHRIGEGEPPMYVVWLQRHIFPSSKSTTA